MRRPEGRPALPHLLFAGLSGTIGVVHVLTGGSNIGTRVVPPMLLSVLLVYAGYRFHRLGPSRRQLLMATALLSGGALYGSGFVLFIELLQLRGSPIAQSGYAILLAGAGGATMAAVIAHYYAAYTDRVAEARAESERARRLQEQVGVLNRALRHNIRNELTVIDGWLDVAFEERTKDGEYRRIKAHLDKVASLSETARRIQDVLETDARVTVDAAERVAAVVDRIESDQPAATVATESPQAAEIKAHPRLDDAIEEMIRNAIEHNDAESLQVEVTVRPTEWDDQSVTEWCIEVADDGSGIPDDERAVLGDTESTPLEHGQGLGLYLVKTIIEESDGRLSVVGDESGTTLRLALPAATPSGAQSSG